MASIINASTSSGLVNSADTSGNLELQSNGTTKVAVSSSGVALTGASLTSFAGGAITQGTAVASTSGTSIDFTSIPSWAKKITVMFAGVSSSGTSPYTVKIGTGSTPTYASSGYIGEVSEGLSNVFFSTNGFVLRVNQSAANTHSGLFTLVNLNSNTWVESSTLATTDTGLNIGVGSGYISLGAALTAVRITTVNGTDTFDAGTINISYEG